MQFITVTKRPRTEDDSYRDIDINIEHIISIEWLWAQEDENGLCGEYTKIGLSNGTFVYVEEEPIDIFTMIKWLHGTERMVAHKFDVIVGMMPWR